MSPNTLSSLPFILLDQVGSFLGFLTQDPSLIWNTAVLHAVLWWKPTSRCNGSVNSKCVHPSPHPPPPLPWGICRAFYSFVLPRVEHLPKQVSPGVGHCQKQFYLFDFKRCACLAVYFKFPGCFQYKNIKTELINCVWEPDPHPHTLHMGIFFFNLELGEGIVVLLLCSVPDPIDFPIVERVRKFNCSSPFLSKVMIFVFTKHGFASVKWSQPKTIFASWNLILLLNMSVVVK